jgi:WD40 repeat protein/transcriptional regulator with XRE-family HTH domain
MLAREPGNPSVESFQGLVLQLRGRTGLSQAEIASRMRRHARSIQGWESGTHYPTAESLRALLLVYLNANAFRTGHELAEAASVWAAALREAPRLRTPFDGRAFAELVADSARQRQSSAPPSSPTATSAPGQAPDWGEAPSIERFHGRFRELEELRRHVQDERCRVVAVLGMGGIGKTTLTARIVEDLASGFDVLYWRSLRDAPLPAQWLGDILRVVSGQHVLPDAESGRLALLVDFLRERRTLLVLDNLETVFEPGRRDGSYRDGYVGYGTIIRRLGESRHQSCLLLTSREAPAQLAQLEGEHAAVRSLVLGGFLTVDARGLLSDKELSGDDVAWDGLVDRYAGNGLALRIAGESIRHVFGGDIADFLAGVEPIFGGVRDVLDEQVGRLSDLERMAMRWLAVEREPITFTELAADLAPVASASVLEAVEALRRRSLLVGRREHAHKLTLHSVVLEHVTERLVEDFVGEIASSQLALLLAQPLLKATAKDYVRQVQERLIAHAIIAALAMRYAGERQIERVLTDLLSDLRTRPCAAQGYGPGNLANLLLALKGDLAGTDLSGLELRHVFLRDAEAQGANMTGSHLTQSVLAESFDCPLPVALSADGAYLAAGTTSGELRLWRVSDRTPVMSMTGSTNVVRSVALSGDGRLLASGSLDGTIKLWDATNGRLKATLPGHVGGVWGVALSGDMRLLASCGQDGSVRLWEQATGRSLGVVSGQSSGVTAVTLSADGRLVASGGQDGTIRIWDSDTLESLGSMAGHSGGVWAVALSRDGRRVASGGADGVVRLWEVVGGECLATMVGHGDQVWGVALSGDGRLLISGGLDGSVKVWNTDGESLRTTLLGHTGGVIGVALSSDGRLAVSGGHDGTVRLWDVTAGRLVTTIQGRADQVYGTAAAADAELLASGGQDGAIRLWKPETGELLATLRGHTGTVWAVALSADGRLVASGGSDGFVRLWDSASGQLLESLQRHTEAVWTLALSAGGQLLASGGGDGNVRVWEPATGRYVTTLTGHTGGVAGVALSADAGLLASGAHDGMVRLWAPATGQLLATLEGHTGAVWCVALSGDGRLVVSGGADGTVRFWDASTGRLAATLAAHTGLVRAVALSADGHVVASGGIDGTLCVWEAPNGRLMSQLNGHGGPVRAVALTADGRLLASGSMDGTLRTWDVRAGSPLQTLRSDRRYERMDITGLTGVTGAQREAMLAHGALERI